MGAGLRVLTDLLTCQLAQEAAQQLKVGLSVLKRICRQMGLARWPYRTRQSLRGVIAKTQQYYRVRAASRAHVQLPGRTCSCSQHARQPALVAKPAGDMTVYLIYARLSPAACCIMQS